MPHFYPAQLAEAVQARWRELEATTDPGPCRPRHGALPDLPQLTRLLSVAYQASLLREEERPVRFRLYLSSPSRIPPELGPPRGLHALLFSDARPYVEEEILRLAPAAKYHRALIGVRPTDDGAFEIWGIVQSGPGWLQSARGSRATTDSPIPHETIVVRAVGPGHVAVAVGDVTLGELRGGRLARATVNAFESRWLASHFSPLRAELMAEHTASLEGLPSVPLEPTVPRLIAQQMVRRIIATIREAHHGGTILFVPEERAAAITSDDDGAVRLKYAFADDEPRRRYRSLIVSMMRKLAVSGAVVEPPLAAVGWAEYQGPLRAAVAPLDEALFEVSHLVAALGDVDGAIMLTLKFEVLGFGGEIHGHLPEVRTVRRALDLEASEAETIPIDGVGTRHRSVYRLCAHERDVVAVVVSQDGSVQFVAWHEGAVTCWDQTQAVSGPI